MFFYFLVILLGLVVGLFFLGVTIILGSIVLIILNHLGLFIQARSAGIDLTISRIVGMRLRGLDPKTITESIIILRKAGVSASFDELESHVLAKGRLQAVVEAMVQAHKANLDISFREICAIDLAGRDVVKAVRACVDPIVIHVPDNPKQKYIVGMTKNGIRVGANVKVTVRANVRRLVGGATESTVVARVGQGIIAAIGMAQSHVEILENPNRISQVILAGGLDTNTAFEIVSVDVGDVEVFDNIGAKLAELQAIADRQVAQARAESRRALAIAAQQENEAKVQEMKALEVISQAQIPQQMAYAYQRGLIAKQHRPVYSVIHRIPWKFY